jgi:carbon-monoxide dehydrogenase large subunit
MWRPADTGGIGAPTPRREDQRLLTGKGRYSDDSSVAGEIYAWFLRSPHAHATIRGIDLDAARALPGVVAIFTGADYVADGFGPIPHPANPIDLLDPTRPGIRSRDGAPIALTPQMPLVPDRARHVGEPVALVLARSQNEAKDAAEAIAIDYALLPSVTALRDAVAPDAPTLWTQAPGNVSVAIEHGDGAAARALLASARHVVEMDLVNPRVCPAPMEPRSALVECASPGSALCLTVGSQGAVLFRDTIARILALDHSDIRVLSRDVGGGFGIRHNVYPEHVALCWAARKLGRSIKWRGDRSEGFLTDLGGRDFVTRARLGLTENGRFLALEVEHLYNLGAHSVSFVPLNNTIRLTTGCYAFEAAYLQGKAVFTNTVPTAPYRGAGRPEAMFNIERLIDTAAAELGFDRLELRRRNLIRPEALPCTNALGLPIADIDVPHTMEQAVAAVDWQGFPRRRAESEQRGRRRGIGLANYLETPTGYLREHCIVEIKPEGEAVVIIGSGASGQGHDTTFAQIVADLLGVENRQVTIVTGDTAIVAKGGGSHSCRTARLGGTILSWSADALIAMGCDVLATAHQLPREEVAFSDRAFRVRNRVHGIFEVARIAAQHGMPVLRTEQEIAKRLPANPSGTAICELEIDPETGTLEILDYVTVDDVGIAINPLLVHGQIHGGIAQGVGQAILEGSEWDPQNGQLLTGSFMDYALPRATDLPSYRSFLYELASGSNPLGIKGAGESGTTPAPAAVMNAIVDALRPYGIRDVRMPATPSRIWRALRDARSAP